MQSEDGQGRAALAPSARAPTRVARVRIGFGAAVGLLLIALVVAVGIGAFAPHGGSRLIASTDSPSAKRGGSGAVTEASAAPTDAAGIFVHVLGAVAHPGLFQLPAGSRVIDAVAAAGGFTGKANRAGVNLARELSDGEQLAVPKVGEPLPAGSGAVPGDGGAQGAKTGRKVNLNSASEAALETLPQIGPVTAKHIVAWRTANGRFTRIEDLMNVSGIGQKTFDSLKDLITV